MLESNSYIEDQASTFTGLFVHVLRCCVCTNKGANVEKDYFLSIYLFAYTSKIAKTVGIPYFASSNVRLLF